LSIALIEDTTEIDELHALVDRLREINRNLHERHRRRVQELMLEIEVASLQAQRPYLKPWEQRQITEAIDALHEGNRFPDCAPITRLMQEI
jgi:hypothetical protein